MSAKVYTYTYPVALPAGTYQTKVMIHGQQGAITSTAWTGNTNMAMIVMVTSTSTAFTFEFVNINTNGGTVLTPQTNPLVVDYITIIAN